MTPDFERARAYALTRLTHELEPRFCYHSVAHTRDDVLPAAERLAALEGVSQAELLLLRTAALYHDLGFLEQAQHHEQASITLARAALPGFGYSAAQVEAVAQLIRATILPQTAHTQLEQLLADADLDVLGRPDFFAKSELLHREQRELGVSGDALEWQRSQLAFLERHRYFTASAQRLRDAGKRANTERLRRLAG